VPPAPPPCSPSCCNRRRSIGDCEEPASHQLARLAADARAMTGDVHTYDFTLTVAGGAVHRVQEFLAINAC
jgi:hypothetical protein